MRKRLLSFVLAVLMIATLLPVTALAYTTYYINGVAVRCDDFDSSPNECWTYANNIYNKIWGQQFNSLFDDSANSLRNLSDSELTLTAEHLRNYVSNAALGSALRICSSEYLHAGDGWGHSQIIVQKDSNGFTVLQGGLSASPYRNERYYTWSEYLNSWNYAYIKYIKWPGAPAYGGGTVTPDPGLSVKETITCKRTIKLPERVVNLYSNPTDTTRFTYFSDGPTAYSSRYAIMSDGSIMYEVGANHQGQDMKLWLQYASDMTVTKEHTYGSTQYESAHPHRGYRVCECGDKTYTGETTTRDDCSECGGEVKYAVEGGYLTFDKKTGTVTNCDPSVTKANIPHTIKGVTVTSIGEEAFYNCRSLTSVTIPGSVTSIDKDAFCFCSSLTSVTIPDSVTSIGDRAFLGCTSLTSVTIPDSVTSIGEFTFYNCKSLTSVTIPDSVTSIGVGAFASCTSLTGIWVTEGNSHYSSDASGVLFSKDKTTLVQCPGTLAACMIPDSVTSIVGYAFDGCASLTSVTIPDGVTSIGEDTFRSCTSLTSVTIPDGVTSIGYNAFGSCESLTDVYYAGSEAQWKAISISSTGNDDLLNANIHYNYVSHTHSYKAVVTAPTCTEKGYTTHTCACGDSYVDTYVDALGHAWDNGKVTKEPTETETGVKTFTCTRCGETKTETIPKLTHEHSYDAVVTAPTCTEKGYTTHTCACGDSYVDTYTDALGHDWDSGTVTKEPTATETGVRTYACTRCNETKTESIPVVSVDVTQMFTDVTHNWAYPGIQYCVTHGIMGGMGDGTFAPTGTTTRAQIVQILYNLEGTPAVSGTTPFTDLTANWYKPAILWAYQNNVVAGTSPTTFDPEGPVTREQIAVILTQYMFHVLKMERTWTPADLSAFPDGAQVSGWAKEAMQDAVALGLINGTKASDGLVYLDPQGSATRQQVATILMNFCQNVKK